MWRILITLILFSVPYLQAQRPVQAPLLNLPDFTTEFNKQNTTWNWFGRINKDIVTRSGWQSSISETFQSNLIIPSAGQKQWKDEHRFNGSFARRLGGHALGLYAHSWLQADKQVADNRYGNHILGAYGAYAVTNSISLEPYAGGQNSRNRAISDWGWDVCMKGNARDIALDEYEMDLDLRSDYDFYEKRKNYEHFVDLNIQTEFNEYTSDSLRLSYSETFKQHYTTTGSELLEAHLYDRILQNKLIYRMSPRRQLFITTLLSSKDISYLSDRSEFLLENQIKLLWFSDRYYYGFSFRTYDESQDASETLSDNQSAQSSFSLNGVYRWNDNNHLRFDLAYVKFQYDTPEENTDDRDEQRFIMNLSYFHRFSSYLMMEWDFYTYLYHQIYLFNPQSQNNNWNRVFKVNPTVSYRNGKLTNKVSSTVLANYTVYDFEKDLTRKTSFIFRKYTLSDSLMIPLYKRFSMVFLGRLELEDKGSFFKEQFAQQVVQSYRSHLFNLQLVNERVLNMRIALGYSRFTRTEWRHLPGKRRTREIVNSGPFLNLSYRNSPTLTLTGYIALSTLDDSNTRKTRVSTGQLRLYYNF